MKETQTYDLDIEEIMNMLPDLSKAKSKEIVETPPPKDNDGTLITPRRPLDRDFGTLSPKPDT